MSTYLDKILAAKRSELKAARGTANAVMSDRQLEQLLSQTPAPRDVIAALRGQAGPRIIAEFKRASPSAGAIRPDAKVQDIVPGYAQAGAAMVSVLTDRHFDGSLADLEQARASTRIPLLRKDFVLERSQIVEARRAGADAVLLICAALPPPALRPLVEFAHSLGLTVLCEAHNEHEVDRAMAAGATLVGVNARDLATFEVDLDRTIAMRRLVPSSFTYVAESGVQGIDDVRRLQDAGVDAILIGSSLMGAEDPAAALQELIEAVP